MNRLVHDMSRAEYDALAFDNWSALKLLGKSPWHYRWAKDHPEQGDTDALKFGRAAHLAVLEPAEFNKQVRVWTGGARRGKAWEEYAADNADRIILTESEAERLANVQAAIAVCDFADPFVTGGRAEVTMLWDTEIVPGLVVPCKGRLDYETPTALVDLKLTRNASPSGFGRQAWDLGYLGQAAFYADGYERVTGKRLPFVLLAVENEEPYCVAAYEVSPAQMARGREEYQRCLSVLSLCRIDNAWPSYATGPQVLSLPPWAEKQAEDALSAQAAWNESNQGQQ